MKTLKCNPMHKIACSLEIMFPNSKLFMTTFSCVSHGCHKFNMSKIKVYILPPEPSFFPLLLCQKMNHHQSCH